jgi:thiol:disulfide interchange protein DsbC
MRSFTYSLIRLFAGVVLLLGGPPAFADDELDAVREKVAGLFDSISAEDVDTSGVDGWYKIQRGAIIAYISADGRYLMQGDMIDLDEQVNLTELARNGARRHLIESLGDGQVITFAPAEVKHTVTVFTDVECGYCRRLHSQINDYLANGIAIRYLLYPRNGPASRAWNTSEDVWCSPDRKSALTAAKLDHEFETQKCDASAVQDHYTLGQEIGLTGTPAIVLEDGELIAGYLPADQLSLRLEAKAK